MDSVKIHTNKNLIDSEQNCKCQYMRKRERGRIELLIRLLLYGVYELLDIE